MTKLMNSPPGFTLVDLHSDYYFFADFQNTSVDVNLSETNHVKTALTWVNFESQKKLFLRFAKKTNTYAVAVIITIQPHRDPNHSEFSSPFVKLLKHHHFELGSSAVDNAPPLPILYPWRTKVLVLLLPWSGV